MQIAKWMPGLDMLSGFGIARSPQLGPVVRPYRWLVAPIIALGLVTSLLESIGIGLVIPLAQQVLGPGSAVGLPQPLADVAEWLGITTAIGNPFTVAAAILAVLAVKSACQSANQVLLYWVRERVMLDTNRHFSRKLLALPFAFFQQTSAGRVMHILNHQVWVFASYVGSLLNLLQATSGLALLAVLLALLEWRLFSLVAAAGLLAMMVLGMLERAQRRRSHQLSDQAADLSSRALQLVDNARAIRLFGTQEHERREHDRQALKVHRLSFEILQVTAVLMPALGLFLAFLLIVLVLAGYALQVPWTVTLAFVLLLTRMQSLVGTVAGTRAEISGQRGAVRDVEWLLAQEEPDRLAASPAQAVRAIDQPVAFEDVWFSYPGCEPALHGCSFAIETGEVTALLGRSGAGKSTVVNLLCGLINPDAGRITCGSHSLADLNVEDWRRRIAVAGQDLDLFPGTIADNIAYGAPGIDQETVQLVADLVQLQQAFGQRADVLEIPVGSRGTLLSGGQRQRVGLARALARRPDLLILDEALNALDARAEAEILRRLHDQRLFRTALVISHRASGLFGCTRGVVLDHGRVIEAGPIGQIAHHSHPPARAD